MYKTIVSKRVIKNHFQYDLWKYIGFIAGFVLLWNLTTTMLAPRTPSNLKFEVYYVGEYIDQQDVETVQAQIEALLPEMEEVFVMPITLQGDSEAAMYSQQKLTVLMAAQEGDLYIFDEDMFKIYAEQGLFMELDQYVSQFESVASAEDLEKGVTQIIDREYDGAGKLVSETPLSEPLQFGLPLGIMKNMKVKNYNISHGQYCGVAGFSENLNEAITVLEAWAK